MKKYFIKIEEIITSSVVIKADSIEEARDRINTGHYNKQEQLSRTTPKTKSCYLHYDEIPEDLRYITVCEKVGCCK